MENLQILLNTPTIGASGAIFGVLLAFGMLFPNTQLMLLFPPIPIKAKYFVIIYGGIELYMAITQPGSNIAHAAHLGGMLFGYLLIRYWRKTTNTLY
jgi:membrane associated rhomboid family serine protease